MSRPIQAVIDTAALEHNLSIARRHAPHSRVMAVIKADAYGHGLLRAAEALARAEGFALLELDAAVRLREAGYRQTILLLEGFFDVDELGWIEQYHLSTVVHHPEQLAMLEAARGRGKLDVFLKLNTGMKDRKSTRLNSSHGYISYAVFCLKKKNITTRYRTHAH